MIWLYTYRVKIGCDDPKVISRDKQRREICFMVKERKKPCPLNSLMKTSELSCQGYILYWGYASNIQLKEEKANNIPIVSGFRDVFLKNYEECSAKRHWLWDWINPWYSIYLQSPISYGANRAQKTEDSVRWAITKSIY